jgi:GPH family glycoside/pentoside/hexuronide:cation symporter
VPGNPFVFIPYALLAGFGTGALFTLPLSMVADTIDLDELKTGKRSEGVYFGNLTLFYKTSQAITVPLIGIMLDLIRFDANAPVQNDLTTYSLGFLLAVGSLISFFLAWLSLRPYHLTEAAVNQIQADIQLHQATK